MTKLTEKQLRAKIKKIYREEKQKLREEAGEMISDKIDEPEDVDAKEDVMAGGDNLEKPMDWVKALDLPKAEGKKFVNTLRRIVKEELSKKEKVVAESGEDSRSVQGGIKGTRSRSKMAISSLEDKSMSFFKRLEAVKDSQNMDELADVVRAMLQYVGADDKESFMSLISKIKASYDRA